MKIAKTATQHHRLSGTIVPLVTPFSARDEFDREAFNTLIDHILSEGADALMVTALTGEGPLLSEQETVTIWETVFERTGNRFPVIPTILSYTTSGAIALARKAEALGATALMIAPMVPELYAGRSQRDVIGFYNDVAAATSLPLILFNYPSLTSVDFGPDLTARLAEIEGVRYIKESTGDSKRVHGIERLAPDKIDVICGAPNVALEALALGCRAWITGIMNVVPRSARQLMRAVHDHKDLELARRIYFEQILPLVDAMAANNNPTGTIKAGLKARGIDVGAPRPPGQQVTEEEQTIIDRIVARIAAAESRTETLLTTGVSA